MDVHAASQHVGGEAVAQGVRRHAADDVSFLRVALEDEPEALSGQALAATVDEQRRLVALTNEARAGEFDVLGNFLHRLIEQRDLTGERLAREMVALAGDPRERLEMGSRARRMAKPDAAKVIVDKVLELAG